MKTNNAAKTTKTNTLRALYKLLDAAVRVYPTATHPAPIERNMSRISSLIDRVRRSERRAMGWL